MFKVILLCLLTCCSSFIPLKQSESIVSEDYTQIVESKSKRDYYYFQSGDCYYVPIQYLTSEGFLLRFFDILAAMGGDWAEDFNYHTTEGWDSFTSNRSYGVVLQPENLNYTGDYLYNYYYPTGIFRPALEGNNNYDSSVRIIYIQTVEKGTYYHNYNLRLLDDRPNNVNDPTISFNISLRRKSDNDATTGGFSTILYLYYSHVSNYLLDYDTYLACYKGDYVYQTIELINNGEYDAGYSNGYSTGLIDGENFANSNYYNEGYTAGQTAGYTTGYNTGVSDSIASGSEAMTIFAGIMDVAFIPVNVFFLMFNYDVFGINIAGFVSGLLTIAIVIILMRFIFGRKV